MATVDAEDDAIDRWVVCWYAFDPERRERRHRVMGAFDNEWEMLGMVGELTDELNERKAAGTAETAEHITGRHLGAGYRAAQEARRLEWKRTLRRTRHGELQ